MQVLIFNVKKKLVKIQTDFKLTVFYMRAQLTVWAGGKNHERGLGDLAQWWVGDLAQW